MDNITDNLNQILKGEHMAVEIYENFIHNVEEEEVKNEFISIQKDHRDHINLIVERIQKLDGKAVHKTGFAGYMADIKTDIESKNMSSEEIIKKAYDGENQGLTMVEEIAKGDLDEESKELIVKIRAKDKEHLKRMHELLAVTD